MRNEHKIKDAILEVLAKGDSLKASEIVQQTGINKDIVITFLEDFHEIRYIRATKPTDMDKVFGIEPTVKLIHRGYFFLKHLGGFTSMKKAETKKQRLNIAKEIMTYTSTVAIIVIGYWNYVATDKANDNALEKEKFVKQISALEAVNDSLIRVMNRH